MTVYTFGSPESTKHPYCIKLIPTKPLSRRLAARITVDADCTWDVLNSAAFEGYLRNGVPIEIRAARARDLRPILKRADKFRQRGFNVVTEVVR